MRAVSGERTPAPTSIGRDRRPLENWVYTPSDSDPEKVVSQMAERIAAGNPPEMITLLNSGLEPFLQTNSPNSLYVLNDFLASPAEADSAQKVYPELLADGTIDGKIYGVPSGAYCWNTLFYNKTVFAAHKLNSPTTLDEFRTVCQTLKAAGVTPLSTQMPSKLVDDLAPAVMGGQLHVSQDNTCASLSSLTLVLYYMDVRQ